MKLGVAVSTEKVSFHAIVYNGADMEESVREFSGMGYRGVDLFAGFLSPGQAREIRELYARYDVEVAMFLPIRLSEGGGSFTHPDPAVREQYLRGYMRQMDIAAILGTRFMPIGFSRGNRGPYRSARDYCTVLADSVARLSEYGGPLGITLCLEPINRYEVDMLNSTDECLRFLEDYRLPDTRLLLDTFHMNIEDRDPEESIRKVGRRIGHFHAADSNRLGAGKGHIDYDRLIRALQKAGYEGYLSMEAIPEPSPRECAKESADFLAAKLRVIGHPAIG